MNPARIVIQRPVVQPWLTALVTQIMAAQLEARKEKHGPGAYVGPHETLGIIEEEMLELKQAIIANAGADTCEELIDVAVGCIFGAASLTVLGRDGGWLQTATWKWLGCPLGHRPRARGD